jgi:hypothetical protein
MKLSIDENNNILLEEVYNSIILKTVDNEEIAICMRDSGFEFNYQGKWYSAKEGLLKSFKVNNIKEDNKILTLKDIDKKCKCLYYYFTRTSEVAYTYHPFINMTEESVYTNVPFEKGHDNLIRLQNKQDLYVIENSVKTISNDYKTIVRFVNNDMSKFIDKNYILKDVLFNLDKN